jgi:hypothetical protein
MPGKMGHERSASELAFEEGVTMCILPDEMKGVFTNVEAIECDSRHDDLLSRKETAQQA